MLDIITGIISLLLLITIAILLVKIIDKEQKEKQQYRKEKIASLTRIAHAVEHNTNTLMHMIAHENAKDSTIITK